MKLSELVLVAIFISASSGAFYRIRAPVKDPALRDQGYSCYTDEYNIGLMKNHQQNNNYSPTVCGRVECTEGELEFASCGKAVPGTGCKLDDGDPSKPYPECCPKIIC